MAAAATRLIVGAATFLLIPLTVGVVGYGCLSLVTGAITSPQVLAPLLLWCAGCVSLVAKRPRWAVLFASAGLATLALAVTLEARATAAWED